MNSSVLNAGEMVKNVSFARDAIIVDLLDGRTISAPLVWFPRLLHATPAQRKKWKIAGGGFGIRWEELDEDLSTAGLLRGAPAPGAIKTRAA
ncbi:MAG: DUF2442 domain-containing protein [Candidatus Riflebacteria bacterium HGW-Riflebacteria-1]|jgi:hypothetical protein|nr:MAG: DUF2442 domain-containing protein [Candidatus Riflebacteria bacterium HGW-Riflebacteria-1]